jgi:hypothetical protein
VFYILIRQHDSDENERTNREVGTTVTVLPKSAQNWIYSVFNSKFPPPVELCWQNKNKLGIVNYQCWQYNYFINMIRKRNLLDAKMKNTH